MYSFFWVIPGNRPKERIQHPEQDESFKSRMLIFFRVQYSRLHILLLVIPNVFLNFFIRYNYCHFYKLIINLFCFLKTKFKTHFYTIRVMANNHVVNPRISKASLPIIYVLLTATYPERWLSLPLVQPSVQYIVFLWQKVAAHTLELWNCHSLFS